MVDAHVHIVDFMQETDGAPALIEAMDDADVERAVVFGLPAKKKWASTEPDRPGYYLDDEAQCFWFSLTDQLVAEQLKALPGASRARLAPTFCGFDPTDLTAVEHLERAWERYDGLWRGVGEILLRHDELTARISDEIARPNHPAMRRVAEFCAEQGVPLAIHSNGGARGHQPESYVPEIEELLAWNTGATIVWCHCGVSRIHAEHDHLPVLRRLLGSHERLHLDLSGPVVDSARGEDGAVRGDWVEFLEEHSERLVIGSDSEGHFKRLGSELRPSASLLEPLSERARRRIAGENAMRLWFRDE